MSTKKIVKKKGKKEEIEVEELAPNPILEMILND